MIIEGDTIIFNSYPKNWKLEALEFKPNTVRLLDTEELTELEEAEPLLIKIKIINTRTKAFFTRRITDICIHERVYDEEYLRKQIVIFSFNRS